MKTAESFVTPLKYIALATAMYFLQGSSCHRTFRGSTASPSGPILSDSKLLIDQREGLTRVNIKEQNADTKDMIFEPDYLLRGPDGSRFWGFIITIENAGMPLFQGKIERSDGSWPIALIAPTTIYTQNYDPRSSISRELAFILNNEIRAKQELYNEPPAAIVWLQPSHVRFPIPSTDTARHRLGLLIPDEIVPAYPATATVKIFTKPNSPAVFQLTKQGVVDILAIGESVGWGQGLNERNKFQAIVAQAMASELGRGARLYRFAQSGATVEDPEGPPAPCTRTILDKEIPGEMGDDYTDNKEHRGTRLVCQAESFKEHPYDQKLDLILVNGCLNDVSIENLLCFFAFPNFKDNCAGSAINFFPLDNPLDSFRDVVDDKCGFRVKGLLNVLKRSFPDTPIVLMGYYAFKPEFFGGWERLKAPFPGLGHNSPDEQTRTRIEQRADLWETNTKRALAGAVQEANGPDPRQRNIIFAPVRLDGFPQPTLWELTDGPLPWNDPTPIDPMADNRRPICRILKRANDPICLWASFGHPNPQGHIAYAKAAVDALQSLGKLPRGSADPAKCIPEANQPNQTMGICGDMDDAYDPNCLLARFEDPSWNCPR